MNIKEIVEATLVAPMREQAAAMRFADNVRAIEQNLVDKQSEIQRLNSLCDWYRTQNARHEHLIGELHERFQNKAARDELLLWDEMHDMVRDAYLAIHGPSDSDL
jgi:hypothetical protein